MHQGLVGSQHASTSSIRIHEAFISAMAALLDFSLITFLGLAIYLFYPGWSSDAGHLYLAAILFTATAVVTSLKVSHCYTLENLRFRGRELKRAIGIFTLVFLITISLGFVFKISYEFSRIWLLTWFAASIITFSATRALIRPTLMRLVANGQLIRNVAIVGAGEHAEQFLERLRDNTYPWINLVGIYDDRRSRLSDKLEQSMGIAGDTTKLINDARNGVVDDIVIALPPNRIERVQQILNKLEVLPANINLSPDISELTFGGNARTSYGDLQLLNLRKRPMEGWRQFVKFLEDRIIAALIFVAILPVMAVIALLIKLDSPGPVLFAQNRYGFNNKLIRVYKFRSMYSDQTDANAEKLVTKGDSRITKIGAFLRRTSLDELPQFINVLKGEMSIVGPRPHALKASAAGRLYDEIVDDYAKRHRVKPGITGWAQINGWRGETDTEEKILKRVEYDLEYIENWSLSFDLKIILKTIFGGFSGKNAY